MIPTSGYYGSAVPPVLNPDGSYRRVPLSGFGSPMRSSAGQDDLGGVNPNIPLPGVSSGAGPWDSQNWVGMPYTQTTFDDQGNPTTNTGTWRRTPGYLSRPDEIAGALTVMAPMIGGELFGAAGEAGASGGEAASGAGEATAGGLGGDTGLYGSGVDEFGNPTGGNFSGGPGTPGAGDFSGAPGEIMPNTGVDEFGNPTQGNFQGGPGSPGGGDFFDPSTGMPSNGMPRLPGLPGSGQGGGQSFPSLFGGGGPSMGSMIPPSLALAYAARQQPIDTSRLRSTYDAAGANAPLFVNAAMAPAQRAQAAGYGDILQSQGQRGIRGSSFGDTSISDYLSKSNENIGNIGASAAAQALGLQGNLAGNIANLDAQSQMMKNNLYGRAFDMFGRSLNPNAYNPSINMGGGPGAPGVPGGPGNPLANLGGMIPPFMRMAGGGGNFVEGGGFDPSWAAG